MRLLTLAALAVSLFAPPAIAQEKPDAPPRLLVTENDETTPLFLAKADIAIQLVIWESLQQPGSPKGFGAGSAAPRRTASVAPGVGELNVNDGSRRRDAGGQVLHLGGWRRPYMTIL